MFCNRILQGLCHNFDYHHLWFIDFALFILVIYSLFDKKSIHLTACFLSFNKLDCTFQSFELNHYNFCIEAS